MRNIVLNVFNKGIQFFIFFSWLLPIYRNYKSWIEFQVTLQELVWLNSIYYFDHIMKLLIEYAFSLNWLLVHIENNGFYTKLHKTSFGNSISKYRKYLFQCMTDSKSCLRNSRFIVLRSLFHLYLDETECYRCDNHTDKSLDCRSQGIHSFLSWADTGSLLTWPCCCWAGGFKLIRHDDSHEALAHCSLQELPLACSAWWIFSSARMNFQYG